jgi:cytochrome bd-type quinol oxidase subunit 2
MKQRMVVAGSLLLTSFVLALVGGYLILIAFQEGDCDGGCNSGALLWSIPALFFASLILGGVLWLNSQRTWRSLICVVAMLGVAILVPAVAAYAYQLHQKKQLLEQQALVRTNQDYSHMLIAVRDVPALGVSAGERCIFSVVDCGQLPRRIEALCQHQGMVSIT